MKSGLFFGWWVVAGTIGLQILSAGLMTNAYGAYVVALRQEFGWSATLLSLGSSLSRLESGVLGPPQGWMIDRFGPRIVAIVGVVMFAAGLVAFAFIDSEVSFIVTYLFLSIGAGLAGYMTLSVAVVNWFERRRATALGIMGAGFGIGALILPGVVWALTTFGWRATSFGSGVAVLVLGIPCALLLRRRPEDYGLMVDGGPARLKGNDRASVPVADAPEFTIGQALRTRSFWFLSFGHASALLIVSAVIVHLIAFLNGSLGYSLEAAATISLALPIMQMAGQLGGGFLGDRFDKRLLCIVCMLAHAAGLLLLANATSLWMVLGFTVLHGVAWGVRGPLMHAIRADYFGRGSFGRILGFSSLIVMTGSIVGPLVAGVLYDLTGSYTIGFDVLALMAGLGSVFFLFATRPAPPARPAEAPVSRPVAAVPTGVS